MPSQAAATGIRGARQLFQEEERYHELAREHRPAYEAALPFPHVVLDDFLPVEVCEGLLEEFPEPSRIDWMRVERHHSKKLATRGDGQFGKHTRFVMQQLNGAAFLEFLETLTGITGLIPDPYFEGGGLHQIQDGGYLKVHADFNWNKKLSLDRRINFILYLNKDWREEYHGHLELWDRSMTRCVRKVLPIYNRCVIFNTTSWSYHGHPEKLACPPGRTRKSLALYYYSNGRPEGERGEKHGTLWQERPPSGRYRGLVGNALRASASVVEAPGRWLRSLANRLG
ncbi:MAG: 2OG-Fe(II) oxygenase [Planctomycetes bacterium]|nr:2OG-Fe(II) oxygenase [Planctomycetota bacterium]